MTFKRGHIEVCLTTEDGIQHLRCHGWLKRERILVKAEQVFGKGSNDFGMFIIVIPSEELYEIMDLKDDMFSSFEVMSKEEERWSSYKKKKDKDFIQNISNFMFSLAPENKIDIDETAELIIYPQYSDEGGTDSERIYIRQLVQKYVQKGDKEDLFTDNDFRALDNYDI